LNTTTKSGRVGDTLSAGGLHATLIKFDRSVPRPEVRDITGFGTLAAGMRFYGVKAKVCNDRRQAIIAQHFGLKVDGGKSKVKFPQSAYDDGFDSTRQGCETGWIVFEAPKGSRASEVTFKYDDTGSSQASGKPEKHARFSWKP
jgi:hypothetical protein